MNLYLKTLFLGCLLIVSCNTILSPQSLDNKNYSMGLFSELESDIRESNKQKDYLPSDSIQKSKKEIKRYTESSTNKSVSLKSSPGVFSFFDELIFYWFNQF